MSAPTKQTPEFSLAASRLTCTDVFFTSLLYTLKIVPDENFPGPAATDGVRLIYNPKLFRDMFVPAERVFVLVHEILHVVLFHPTRRGVRDPKRWNSACDHAANLLAIEYGFLTQAQVQKRGFLADPRYAGMTAEQVYDLLPEEESEGGNGQGKPGQPQRSMGGDVLDYKPENNGGVTKAGIERETAINTEQALHAAKAAGTQSAAMKKLLKEAQVDREPWYQHLRRYMVSMHNREYNWNRINPRMALLFGVVSPQQRTEQMGKVVVLTDESGSMTDQQRAAISAHVSDICKDVTPRSVVVAHFDTEVVHSDEYTGPDYAITLERHGGGGTDFVRPVEWVMENHSDAHLILVFTDLYGPFGEEPGIPVLWVSQTTSVPVPWGELIYGDLNEG